MNKRENWGNHNQYLDQYVYPQPEIPSELTSPSTWVHVPPQTMPWGLPSNPPVVRFTAGDYIHPNQQHHPTKRKPDSFFDLRPSKQLVTEEKMAAHMSNLHISDIDVSNMTGDDEMMEGEQLPKLIISDEVKNIKTKSLIPESIINQIERPKMALVLWQPPPGDFSSRLMELKKSKEKASKVEKEESMGVDNNNTGSTFRPIDPVPMHSVEHNQFLQPTPQFRDPFTLS